MVSKSVPKSNQTPLISSEEQNQGATLKQTQYNKSTESNSQNRRSSSNDPSQTNSSERPSSSSSDQYYYDHERVATSSTSPSNYYDNALLIVPFPSQYSFSEPPPCWAKRRYQPSFTGLDEEIRDFYHWLRPTAEEIACRRMLFNKITHMIRKIWPDSKVEMFGSVATNSFLPSSDVDICIMKGSRDVSTPEDLAKVADTLRTSHEFEEIIILDKTAVPIVKCIDKATQLKIDVNFNLDYVGRTVEWIQKKMFELPSMEALLMVLKQFLAQRSLNNPFNGGLSSYALVCMIVHFIEDFRMKNRLNLHNFPNLDSITNRGKKTLGFLFHYFLWTYSRFDFFNNGIIFYKKHGFIRSRVVEKKYLVQRYGLDVYSSGFWISDPINEANNLGRGAHNIMAIKIAFTDAFFKIQNALAHLANQPDDIMRFYYGPLLKLIIDTDIIGNRRENIIKSRSLLFGQLLGKTLVENEECDTKSPMMPLENAQKNEEEKENKSREVN